MNLITGNSFSESSVLNILIVLLEIAAAMGFYGSPALIYRFAVKETGTAPSEAKKINLALTVLFLVLLGASVFVFHLSVLMLAGVLVWSFFNYRILIHGYRKDETGEPIDSGFIVRLFDKYQEIVIYIIVGVFATVVSWGVFFILSKVLDSENSVLLTVNTILNWCAGVAVAYPMNRSWVFKSKSEEKWKEFLHFVLSRVGTLIIEALLMPLLVNVIGMDQYIAKYAVASVVVIILNYIFSKLFVFRNQENRS